MRFRFTELGGTPDDVVQFVEQGPLLINEQFRVTNHVYAQNMSDVQLEMRSSSPWAYKRPPRSTTLPNSWRSRAETNKYGAVTQASNASPARTCGANGHLVRHRTDSMWRARCSYGIRSVKR